VNASEQVIGTLNFYYQLEYQQNAQGTEPLKKIMHYEVEIIVSCILIA
jgi:hypothetical protein